MLVIKHKLVTQYKNLSLRRKEVEVLSLLLRAVEMPDAGSLVNPGDHASTPGWMKHAAVTE